jgi:hypothetical protein
VAADVKANVTGFTLMFAELDAKRLELLKSAFPQISAVSVLRGATKCRPKN